MASKLLSDYYSCHNNTKNGIKITETPKVDEKTKIEEKIEIKESIKDFFLIKESKKAI